MKEKIYIVSPKESTDISLEITKEVTKMDIHSNTPGTM